MSTSGGNDAALGDIKRLADLTDSVVGGCKRFECKVIGFPRPSIRWYKDGENITSHTRYKFDYTREGYIVLIIQDVSQKDQGVYQCRADNLAGMASTSAQLNVKGMTSIKEEQATSVHTMTFESTDGCTVSTQSQKRPLVLEGGTVVEETVEEVEVKHVSQTTTRTVESTLERTIVSFTEDDPPASDTETRELPKTELKIEDKANQTALESVIETKMQSRSKRKIEEEIASKEKGILEAERLEKEREELESDESVLGSSPEHSVVSRDDDALIHVVEVEIKEEVDSGLRELGDADKAGDLRLRRLTDSGIMSRGSSISSEQELSITPDSMLEMQAYLHGRETPLDQTKEEGKHPIDKDSGMPRSMKETEKFTKTQESTYKNGSPKDSRASENKESIDWEHADESEKRVLAGMYLFAEEPTDNGSESTHPHSEFELIKHSEMSKFLGSEVSPESLQSKLQQYVLEQNKTRVSDETHTQESSLKTSKITRRTKNISSLEDDDDSSHRGELYEPVSSITATASTGTPSNTESLDAVDSGVEEAQLIAETETDGRKGAGLKVGIESDVEMAGVQSEEVMTSVSSEEMSFVKTQRLSGDESLAESLKRKTSVEESDQSRQDSEAEAVKGSNLAEVGSKREGEKGNFENDEQGSIGGEWDLDVDRKEFTMETNAKQFRRPSAQDDVTSEVVERLAALQKLSGENQDRSVLIDKSEVKYDGSQRECDENFDLDVDRGEECMTEKRTTLEKHKAQEDAASVTVNTEGEAKDELTIDQVADTELDHSKLTQKIEDQNKKEEVNLHQGKGDERLEEERHNDNRHQQTGEDAVSVSMLKEDESADEITQEQMKSMHSEDIRARQFEHRESEMTDRELDVDRGEAIEAKERKTVRKQQVQDDSSTTTVVSSEEDTNTNEITNSELRNMGLEEGRKKQKHSDESDLEELELDVDREEKSVEMNRRSSLRKHHALDDSASSAPTEEEVTSSKATQDKMGEMTTDTGEVKKLSNDSEESRSRKTRAPIDSDSESGVEEEAQMPEKKLEEGLQGATSNVHVPDSKLMVESSVSEQEGQGSIGSDVVISEKENGSLSVNAEVDVQSSMNGSSQTGTKDTATDQQPQTSQTAADKLKRKDEFKKQKSPGDSGDISVEEIGEMTQSKVESIGLETVDAVITSDISVTEQRSKAGAVVESRADEQKTSNAEKPFKIEEQKLLMVGEPETEVDVFEKIKTIAPPVQGRQQAAEGERKDSLIGGDYGLERLADTMCEVPNIINLANLALKPSTDLVTQEPKIEESINVLTPREMSPGYEMTDVTDIEALSSNRIQDVKATPGQETVRVTTEEMSTAHADEKRLEVDEDKTLRSLDQNLAGEPNKATAKEVKDETMTANVDIISVETVQEKQETDEATKALKTENLAVGDEGAKMTSASKDAEEALAQKEPIEKTVQDDSTKDNISDLDAVSQEVETSNNIRISVESELSSTKEGPSMEQHIVPNTENKEKLEVSPTVDVEIDQTSYSQDEGLKVKEVPSSATTMQTVDEAQADRRRADIADMDFEDKTSVGEIADSQSFSVNISNATTLETVKRKESLSEVESSPVVDSAEPFRIQQAEEEMVRDIVHGNNAVPKEIESLVAATTDTDTTTNDGNLVPVEVQEADSMDGSTPLGSSKEESVENITSDREPEAAVQIITGLSELTIAEEEAIHLQWQVKASRVTDIQILKDGHLLYPSDRVKLSCQGNLCMVDVSMATAEDAAVYSIRADNSKEEKGKIVVEVTPLESVNQTEPDFVMAPTVESSDSRLLSIKCSVKGAPEPVVTWYKRGKNVGFDDLWNMYTKDGHHFLEVSPDLVDDEETIVCRVENEAGFKQTVLALQHEGKEILCENITETELLLPSLECQLTESKDENLQCYEMIATHTDSLNSVVMETGETIQILATDLGEEVIIRSCKTKDKVCYAPVDTIRGIETGKGEESDRRDVSDVELRNAASEEINKHTEQQLQETPGNPETAANMPERRKITSPSPKLHSAPKKKIEDPALEIESRLGYTSPKGSVSRDGVTLSEYEDGTSRPLFKKRLKKLIGKPGEEAKLECVVSGSPLPKVLWLKNNRPLRASDGCRVIVEEETNILLFSELSNDDVGVYTARAMNVNGSVMSTAEVSIAHGKEPVQCSDPPNSSMDLDFTTPAYFFEMASCQVTEGRLARFDCRVVAHPKPEIVWMHEGKVVESEDRLKLLNFNNEIYSLLIQNVQLSDAGKYTCWARNRFGEAMTETYLNVLALSGEEEEGDLAPKFLTKFYSQQTTEGTPVDFKCLVAGRPEPSVAWLLNDIELKETSGLRMRKNDGYCSLEIKSPKTNQSGEYTCQLRNPLGEATCSAQLTVVEDLLHGKMLPKFLKKFDHMTVREGEEAKFTAVIIGEPRPNVVWMYDHKPLDESNRRFKVGQSGDQSTLTIRNARFDDDGVITCKAVNSEGEVYCSANLYVHQSMKLRETPEKMGYRSSKERDTGRGMTPTYREDESKFGYVPTFTKRLQDQAVKKGDKVKFECKVMGIPEPEVSWMKDGRVILPGGRYHMTRDSTGCYLQIDNATAADGGVYTCIISNSQGKSSSSAELKLGEEKRRDTFTPDKYLDDSYVTPSKRPHLESPSPSLSSDAVPKLGYDKPTLLNKHDDSVRLSWMPAMTAGLPSDARRVSYVVESKELPSRLWTKVASDVPGSSYTVRHLRPDKDYEFRVRPQNQYGVGEPTRTAYLEKRADERQAEIRAPPRLPAHRPVITDLSDETLRLAWRPVEAYKSKRVPPVSYTLEAKELPGKEWLPLSTRIRDTSHYLSELPSDRDYMIRVRAENDFGVSDPTDSLWLPRARVFPGVPVSRPEIMEIEPTRAKLSWSRVEVPSFGHGEVPLTYMIEMQEPPSDWRTIARDLYDTEYMVEGLTPGRDYRFRVKAKSPTGVVSEPSPAASTFTALARSRAPVDGLEVLDYEPDSHSINLHWQRVAIPPYHQEDEPLMYMLEFQEPPLPEWRPLVTGIPTTRYRVRNLHPDRDYRFRVRALTSYGVSPPSAVLPVSMKQSVPVGASRTLPPSLMMSELEPDSVRLTWRRPMYDLAEPLYYDVEMNEPPRLSWKPVATGLLDTSYRVSGLTPTKDYQFRVLPRATSKPLDHTQTVSLTTAPVRPRFPLSEPQVKELGSDSVQLTWRPAELPAYQRHRSPLFYGVEMMEQPGRNWVPVARRVQDTTYIVTGLRPDRDYKFRVTAETDAAVSEPSLAAALHRKPAPVFTRDEPLIKDLSQNNVLLTWKPAELPSGAHALAPAVSYIIEVQSPPGIATWSTLYSNHPTPSVRLSDLRPDLDYLARVRAQCGDVITEPTLPMYIPRRAMPPRMPVEEPYAVDITPDTIQLQWRSAELPTHILDYAPVTYRLEAQELPGAGWVTVSRGIPHTDFKVTGLNVDKDYAFRIRAENDYGLSQPTKPIVIKKRSVVPNLPNDEPMLYDVGAGSVRLAWRPAYLPSYIHSQSPITYTIHVQEVPHTTWRPLVKRIPHTSFLVSGLSPDREYNFRITAENEYGSSRPTQAVYMPRMADFKRPISMPEVSDFDEDLTSVKLRWSPRPILPLKGTPKYHVESWEPQGREWRPVARGIPDTSYHVKGLPPVPESLFRVRMETDRGLSEPSLPVSVYRYQASPRFPIHRPQLYDLDAESVRLSWQPVHLDDRGLQTVRYSVEQREVPDKTWRPVSSNIFDTTYRVTSLRPKSDYEFRVRALIDGNASEPSIPVPLYRRSAIPRLQLDAPEVYDVDEDSLSLRWRTVDIPAFSRMDEPLSFMIERQQLPDYEWKPVATGVSATSYRIKDLKPHQDYMFRVRGVYPSGYTEPSPHIPVYRRPIHLSVPISRPEVWEEEPCAARLRWQRTYVPPYQSKPLRYRVEMQEASATTTDWKPVATDVTVPECTVSEISPRKDYHFRIRAVTEDGQVSDPTPPIQYYRSQMPMSKEPYHADLKPIDLNYDLTFASRTYVDHLTKYVPPRLPIDKPEMVVISPETIELAWKSARVPDAIRFTSNLTYTIEVRNPPSFEWRELVSGLKVLNHTMKKIHPRLDYIFRIRAWNEYGCSEPSLPVSLYRPQEYDDDDYDHDMEVEREFELRFGHQVPPRLPMDTPKVSTQSPDAIWFSWYPARVPAYATQTPISYVVEVKELPGTAWSRHTTGLLDTHYMMDGLNPAVDYHIRVRAETEFGVSDPTLPIIIQRSRGSSRRSSTDSDKKSDDVGVDMSYLENITGGVPPRMSSTRPRATNIRPDSLTLSWPMGRVPSYVKNQRVDYVIEMRELPSHTWTVLTKDISETRYNITDLRANQDYMFRVKARNEYGVSEPTLPYPLYRERDDYVPQLTRSRSGSRDSIFSLTSSSWRRGRSASLDFLRGDDDDLDSCLKDKIPTAPEYVSPATTQYGVEGKKGRITLQVRGFPLPTARWYCGEEKVEYGDNFNAFVSSSGLVTLEIQTVGPDSVGDYKCFAENDQGSCSAVVRLELADQPTIIRPLSDQTLTSRSSVTLTCVVDGTPYPTVKWLKDWRPLTESSRVKVQKDSSNEWSVVINNAIANDAGVYACVVENVAGKVTCTARVTVDDIVPGIEDLQFRTTPIQDQYHILQELGRGRHGVVRHVVDKITGQEFAAKFINTRSRVQKDFFNNELETLKLLNHKGALKIHDAFETDRCLIIVTELLTGDELLDKVVTDQNWTEKDAVSVIRQVLDILQHLHSQNVLHLDVKPSNIRFAGPGSQEVKLIDYGLSRRQEFDVSTIQNYGSVGFASPEQITSVPVSGSADVWGVGVLAYILLTGTSPFPGTTDEDILKKTVDCSWSFNDNATLSEPAKDFVSKILQKDASKRMSVEECLQHPWMSVTEAGSPLPTEVIGQFQTADRLQRDTAAVWTTAKLQSLSSYLREKSADMHPLVDRATGEIIFPDSEDYGEYLDEEAWSMWNECYADNPEAMVFPLQDVTYVLKQHQRIPPEGVETSEDRYMFSEEASQPVKETAIMFRNKIENTTFRVGEDVSLSCSIISPEFPAVVTWYRDEQLLSEVSRVSATYVDGVATLTISNTKDYDAAVYKCVARNKDGRVSCQARLLLGDVPCLPGRPIVTQKSDTETFLTWRGPLADGNSYILGYRVDYKISGTEGWTRGPFVVEEYALITGLVPSSEYIFRVSCHNKYGTSPYSWASLPMQTREIGAPPVVMTTELKPLVHFGSFTRQQLILPAESRRPSLTVQGEATLHKENPEETYTVMDTISKGSYGEYKQCVNKASSKACVMKVTPYTEEKHQTVVQEFETLRTLRQGNIVMVIDGYLFGDSFYVVFEKLSGLNVLQYLSLRKWYTEDMVAQVVSQLLSALQYLHSLQIAHLNLQPSSIVMATRRRLHIKLRDFTLSRKVTRPSGVLTDRAGYTDFVAPEILKGDKVNFAADLWSVGAIAFLLLSGVSPFAGDNVRETASNVVFNRHFDTDLYDTVSRQAVRFVSRLLMRIPSTRGTLDFCFEHRWLQLSDAMMKMRQGNVFPTDKMRQFSVEYLRRRADPDYMDLASLDVSSLPKHRETSLLAMSETSGLEVVHPSTQELPDTLSGVSQDKGSDQLLASFPSQDRAQGDSLEDCKSEQVFHKSNYSAITSSALGTGVDGESLSDEYTTQTEVSGKENEPNGKLSLSDTNIELDDTVQLESTSEQQEGKLCGPSDEATDAAINLQEDSQETTANTIPTNLATQDTIRENDQVIGVYDEAELGVNTMPSPTQDVARDNAMAVGVETEALETGGPAETNYEKQSGQQTSVQPEVSEIYLQSKHLETYLTENQTRGQETYVEPEVSGTQSEVQETAVVPNVCEKQPEGKQTSDCSEIQPQGQQLSSVPAVVEKQPERQHNLTEQDVTEIEPEWQLTSFQHDINETQLEGHPTFTQSDVNGDLDETQLSGNERPATEEVSTMAEMEIETLEPDVQALEGSPEGTCASIHEQSQAVPSSDGLKIVPELTDDHIDIEEPVQVASIADVKEGYLETVPSMASVGMDEPVKGDWEIETLGQEAAMTDLSDKTFQASDNVMLDDGRHSKTDEQEDTANDAENIIELVENDSEDIHDQMERVPRDSAEKQQCLEGRGSSEDVSKMSDVGKDDLEGHETPVPDTAVCSFEPDDCEEGTKSGDANVPLHSTVAEEAEVVDGEQTLLSPRVPTPDSENSVLPTETCLQNDTHYGIPSSSNGEEPMIDTDIQDCSSVNSALSDSDSFEDARSESYKSVDDEELQDNCPVLNDGVSVTDEKVATTNVEEDDLMKEPNQTNSTELSQNREENDRNRENERLSDTVESLSDDDDSEDCGLPKLGRWYTAVEEENKRLARESISSDIGAHGKDVCHTELTTGSHNSNQEERTPQVEEIEPPPKRVLEKVSLRSVPIIREEKRRKTRRSSPINTDPSLTFIASIPALSSPVKHKSIESVAPNPKLPPTTTVSLEDEQLLPPVEVPGDSVAEPTVDRSSPEEANSKPSHFSDIKAALSAAEPTSVIRTTANTSDQPSNSKPSNDSLSDVNPDGGVREITDAESLAKTTPSETDTLQSTIPEPVVESHSGKKGKSLKTESTMKETRVVTQGKLKEGDKEETVRENELSTTSDVSQRSISDGQGMKAEAGVQGENVDNSVEETSVEQSSLEGATEEKESPTRETEEKSDSGTGQSQQSADGVLRQSDSHSKNETGQRSDIETGPEKLRGEIEVEKNNFCAEQVDSKVDTVAVVAERTVVGVTTKDNEIVTKETEAEIETISPEAELTGATGAQQECPLSEDTVDSCETEHGSVQQTSNAVTEEKDGPTKANDGASDTTKNKVKQNVEVVTETKEPAMKETLSAVETESCRETTSATETASCPEQQNVESVRGEINLESGETVLNAEAESEASVTKQSAEEVIVEEKSNTEKISEKTVSYDEEKETETRTETTVTLAAEEVSKGNNSGAKVTDAVETVTSPAQAAAEDVLETREPVADEVDGSLTVAKQVADDLAETVEAIAKEEENKPAAVSGQGELAANNVSTVNEPAVQESEVRSSSPAEADKDSVTEAKEPISKDNDAKSATETSPEPVVKELEVGAATGSCPIEQVADGVTELDEQVVKELEVKTAADSSPVGQVAEAVTEATEQVVKETDVNAATAADLKQTSGAVTRKNTDSVSEETVGNSEPDSTLQTQTDEGVVENKNTITSEGKPDAAAPDIGGSPREPVAETQQARKDAPSSETDVKAIDTERESVEITDIEKQSTAANNSGTLVGQTKQEEEGGTTETNAQELLGSPATEAIEAQNEPNAKLSTTDASSKEARMDTKTSPLDCRDIPASPLGERAPVDDGKRTRDVATQTSEANIEQIADSLVSRAMDDAMKIADQQ